MIIDLILDRKDGYNYDPRTFYNRVCGYEEVGEDIANALDSGTERDVKIALQKYILEGDYNLDLIQYIQSEKWLPDEN